MTKKIELMKRVFKYWIENFSFRKVMRLSLLISLIPFSIFFFFFAFNISIEVRTNTNLLFLFISYIMINITIFIIFTLISFYVLYKNKWKELKMIK